MEGLSASARRAAQTARRRIRRVARAVRDTIRLFTRPVPAGTRPYVLAGVVYGHASAGVRVCHRLVHELNERGYRAYSTEEANPDWNETQILFYGLWRRFHDPIAIYSEVVSGNPLGATRVVRWVLNTPGHIAGDLEFPPSELIYTWSKQYYDTDRILIIDVTEHEIFNSVDLPPKTVDCFYMGKAALRGVEAMPLTDGMTEITETWPAQRPELADLLRRTRTLYSYDDRTSLAWEALLCGCRVIILPENHEITMADAKRDMPDTDFEGQLTRFIEETQGEWPI